MPTGRKPLSPEAMLAYLRENVYRDGDCLVWAGPFFAGTRRPQITWNIRGYSARRLLLELSGRRIKGRVVYATCGEPRCMNVAHLRAGTRADATRQAASDGAFPTGARRSLLSLRGHSRRARLGLRHAPEVLMLRANGTTLAQIGERYGVSQQAVSQAIAHWRRAGINPWSVA